MFDVGAFDCAWSLAFKNKYPECRVVAFEGCPDNCALIDQFEGRGVEIVRAAVCDHENGVDFWSNTEKGGPGCSGSILPPLDALKKEFKHLLFRKEARRVPSIRLDAFCSREGISGLDVLHMDVQGAELLVLKGMGELHPRVLSLEVNETKESGHYDGAAPLKELCNELIGRGYHQVWTDYQDAIYIR